MYYAVTANLGLGSSMCKKFIVLSSAVVIALSLVASAAVEGTTARELCLQAQALTSGDARWCED